MIKIHDCIQGDEIWHDLHDNLWTGSVAIKLLQGKPLPKWDQWGGNKYTKRGQILENIAIGEYQREVKHKIQRPGFVTNSLYPNAGYSPDGIYGKTLLEVKCLNNERHQKLIEGDIPLEYLAQIQFGMIILNLKKAKLLAYNPESEKQLTVIDIPYDKDIGANIRRKLRASI